MVESPAVSIGVPRDSVCCIQLHVDRQRCTYSSERPNGDACPWIWMDGAGRLHEASGPRKRQTNKFKFGYLLSESRIAWC